MAIVVEAEKSTSSVAKFFELGKHDVSLSTKDSNKQDKSSPPTTVVISTPIEAGTYPVILFVHGFLINPKYYRQLFTQIASHGFILVAPEVGPSLPWSLEDINTTAAVANWFPVGLQQQLPSGVIPLLSKLTLAGHSKGGLTAFSLALDPSKLDQSVSFSLLIGVDPIAGPISCCQLPPHILNYKPHSFNLDGTPVLVIGSGLGSQWKDRVIPPCAPEGVNSEEFYKESQPPCYYFVVSDYGHLDFLDDEAPKYMTCICKSGNCCRELMRRTTAGLVVAFLVTYFGGDKENEVIKTIADDPEIAPTRLYPVSYIEK